MSDQEGFLTRWSRRKRATSPRLRGEEGTHADAGSYPPAPLGGEGGEDRRSEPGGRDYARSEFAEAPPTPDPSPPFAARMGGREQKTPAPQPPSAFDLASLPPIESITAGTDISAFLAPGVPAELSRAALRRAWVADPAIRDFVGLAENAWDFTAPGGVPGFGPLRAIDDVRRLAAQLMGNPSPADPDPVVAAGPSGQDRSVADARSGANVPQRDIAADSDRAGQPPQGRPPEDRAEPQQTDDAAVQNNE